MNINLMEQHIWILNENQFKELKTGKIDKYIDNQIPMRYKDIFTFNISIRRVANGFTGFRFGIKRSNKSSLSGNYSIMIDEIGFVTNKWPFRRLQQGAFTGNFLFAADSLNQMQTITIHFSLIIK